MGPSSSIKSIYMDDQTHKSAINTTTTFYTRETQNTRLMWNPGQKW